MPTANSRTPRAEVREHILTAALDVFAERGFERSSLDLVAQRAGFTKGAVYSNFTSKDALFLALMDRQVERRIEGISSRLASLSGTDPEQLGAELATASVNDRDWQLVFLDYWARAVRDPEIRAQFVLHRRRIRAAIAAVLRDLVPASSDHAEQLAALVLMLSNGYAIEALADPGSVDPAVIGRAWQRSQR